MAKLSPPLISGVIPAFYSEDINQGAVLTVPFSMNRAVGSLQVAGFVLKMKTIQSSTYLFTSEFIRENTNDKINDNATVSFYLTAAQVNQLKIGQSYKCQIAYKDTTGEIGHYSTVGIVKYTTKPTLTIDNLTTGHTNMHVYEYLGVYSQEGRDVTERAYSYRFQFWDQNDNLILDSGEKLHNAHNDETLYESFDNFTIARDLDLDQVYFLQYTVTTLNGMVCSSPRYRIMQKLSIDAEIDAEVMASLNYNNGYIDISLVGSKNADGLEEPVTGAFLLTRSSEDSNFTVWDEISRFKLAGQTPSRWLWRDYTVLQGKKYRYALQQYNDQRLYSNKILSNIVYADFEDAFLFDGYRQLKIRYNPKVTSFKPNVLESKTNTIGSKYPFIFRNGQVYYHEFPISGLISYQMDEDNLFSSISDFDYSRTSTISQENQLDNLSTKITKERDFKTDVLAWLTDGTPKLFRTPTEGNFIVQLMNVSLSPNDVLGRMLHTFNATAYEIAEHTYENLNKYNFIHLENPEVESLRWETIEFADRSVKGRVTPRVGVINPHKAYTVQITGLYPGDYLYLVSGVIVNLETTPLSDLEQYKIVIGATGSYYIESPVPIDQIIIPEPGYLRGSVTYSYYSILQNRFNKISNVSVIEIPSAQFIGDHEIIREIEYVRHGDQWIKNPKIDIIEFYHISMQKRIVNKTTSASHPIPNLQDLYAVGVWKTTGQYNLSRQSKEYIPSYYIDYANNNMRISADNYDPAFYIDSANNRISIDETESYYWDKPGKPSLIKVGNGTIAEVSYQIRITDFSIEEEYYNATVYAAKKKYLDLQDQLDELLAQEDTAAISNKNLGQRILETTKQMQAAYANFIAVLVVEQEKEREAERL